MLNLLAIKFFRQFDVRPAKQWTFKLYERTKQHKDTCREKMMTQELCPEVAQYFTS